MDWRSDSLASGGHSIAEPTGKAASHFLAMAAHLLVSWHQYHPIGKAGSMLGWHGPIEKNAQLCGIPGF
jgi:hypothetical protein